MDGYWRCTDKALGDYRSADNRRLTIIQLSAGCRLILKIYFVVLFKLFILAAIVI